jgi:uncharacterized RDD family membrane protein YckC
MAGPHVETTAYPAADLDRRFHAFLIDRLLAWGVYAAAGWVAWAAWFRNDSILPGVLLVLGVVLVVGLASAAVVGVTGTSPGRAATGLRVVQVGTGTPIGVGPALLRALIVGAATLPTFGLGVATLAQTAALDPTRQRRGWHDRLARSIVVDVRPAPADTETVGEAPRPIVNLTAMRLVPARPADLQPPAPAPKAPPAAAVAAAQSGPAAPAEGRRRRGRRAAVAPSDPQGPPPGPPPGWLPPGPPPQAAPPVTPPPVTPPPSTPAYDPDRTVVRGPGGDPPPAPPQPVARWRVRFDTGETFLVEGLGLIGRRPEPRAGEPVRHLVALPSKDLSLSKTHAQFQVAPDGVLVVMDRGSTNGSTLVRSGVARSLPVGRPTTLVTGDEVKFGDRSMQVFREG